MKTESDYSTVRRQYPAGSGMAFEPREFLYFLPTIKIRCHRYRNEVPIFIVCGEERSVHFFNRFAVAACYLGFVESTVMGQDQVQIPLHLVDDLTQYINENWKHHGDFHDEVMEVTHRLLMEYDPDVSGKVKVLVFNLMGKEREWFKSRLFQSLMWALS